LRSFETAEVLEEATLIKVELFEAEEDPCTSFEAWNLSTDRFDDNQYHNLSVPHQITFRHLQRPQQVYMRNLRR
jgi:hypothetical protein